MRGFTPREARRRVGALGSLAATALVLPGVLGAAPLAQAATATTKASTTAAGYRRFTSCDAFLAYVRSAALPRVGPYGFDAGYGIATDVIVPRPSGTVMKSATATTAAAATTAAPAVAAAPAAEVSGQAGGASSSTNTQEVGVDEGDLVENDGRNLYSVVDGRLRIVDTTTYKELWSDALPNGFSHQLLLDGRRLAVVSGLSSAVGPETVVTLYDVTNPAAPVLLRRTHLEGNALASRAVDHRARIVLQTPFGQRLKFFAPQGGDQRAIDAATAANKNVVRKAKAADWLPRMYVENADTTTTPARQALSCGEVGRPADYSGLGTTWVATLDLDVPNARTVAIGSAGVVTDSGTVYSSSRTLYVATVKQRLVPILPTRSEGGVIRPITPEPPVTALHAFDLAPKDGAAWVASGKVNGTVLNQFSMSEYGGVFRIATTTADSGFGGTTESGVHVLARSGRRLVEIGTLGGLGRTERIFGVRFVGDLGYVVTFRQTDPLYVIDLRDPRAPRLAGVLKVPGYSAYLHPIGNGLLLTIGQDATDTGRRLGTQLQLFDVNDPYNPTRLSQLSLGGSSEAEYDHHAFLWWDATKTVFVPSVNYGGVDATGKAMPMFAGVVAAAVEGNAIVEKGRISHNAQVQQNQGSGPIQAAPSTTTTPTTPPTTTATTTAPTTVTTPNGAAPSAVAPVAPPICGPNTPGCSPVPPPVMVAIRRSLVIAGRLVTVSDQGTKVSDLASYGDLGWVRYNR